MDTSYEDPARCISFKLKFLRKSLLQLSKNLSQLTALLVNCNAVINFLDLIEEHRPLTMFEWNFREIAKSQTFKLLEFKKLYCKKWCTNRWMLLGEENTNFFKAIAT
mgnify:CR=1 FL=1